jgi:hypothetical protein
MEIVALFPEYIVGFRAKGYYVALDDRFTEARARVGLRGNAPIPRGKLP